MNERLKPSHQDDELALRTYSLVFDTILQCSSAEEQRRMASFFLSHSAVLCRFLGHLEVFEDVMRKIRAVDIGPDWLRQVMQMH
ncbi:hypothetical protein [Pseudomonas chlororaphis]|uniref:hypothetical protein n=1 Tax=Pseudomonas chlororaphis TaxID=587753 RepID=UPI00046FBA0A|nr:hypothetical protein [Pseudomonas chlororaphis]